MEEIIYKEIESVVFPSDQNTLIEVETLVDEICAAENIHEDYYGNILIAVTEALNNAVLHGNKEDASKKVYFTVKRNDTQIQFIIQDEGEGFAYDNLPDPTAPENIEKESGRGIFLIKALADDVQFEDGGRRVIITFTLN